MHKEVRKDAGLMKHKSHPSVKKPCFLNDLNQVMA